MWIELRVKIETRRLFMFTRTSMHECSQCMSLSITIIRGSRLSVHLSAPVPRPAPIFLPRLLALVDKTSNLPAGTKRISA